MFDQYDVEDMMDKIAEDAFFETMEKIAGGNYIERSYNRAKKETKDIIRGARTGGVRGMAREMRNTARGAGRLGIRGARKAARIADRGIRRTGKSIFAIQLFSDKQHGYINFDDERIVDIGTQDLTLNRYLID